MNKCTDGDVREMLPDLLHRTLPANVRERVEAHVATCEECREELKVLRAVHSAAVFAPQIDVDKVVRQIPPYQRIVPAAEMPARARPRLVSWLTAAIVAIGVVGVGSMLVTRQDADIAPAPATVVASGAPTLALPADVEGLSDGSLVQLMNEMNEFDALPATEVDPVIPVDAGENIDQDLR